MDRTGSSATENERQKPEGTSTSITSWSVSANECETGRIESEEADAEP